VSDTQYEVIVFGASSFVGQIICEYLSSYRGEEPPLRWSNRHCAIIATAA